MSADVASYHGGDGGGDDPLDPTREPASCESSGIFFIFLSKVFHLLT